MKNKILIIIVLLGLLPFSCGKLELTKTGNDPLNESANGTLKDGLLPLCNIADAVVGKIGITSVVGNTFQYKFVVSNAGAGILYLNRMYFQTYLSEDAILDAADQAAGGSIFGDTAPALNFHESFTQAWYYNPTSPVDITRYHFVIIQVLVRPKFSMPECSTTNNVRAQDIGCNLSEAFISNITINNISATANTFDYTFTVTNSGWTPLPLSQLFFQTYVSKDAVYDISDKAAGGSIFNPTPPNLAKDESYSQNWYYNPTAPEDLTVYKYLIIQIGVWSGTVPECNLDNNTASARIVIDIPRNGLVAFYPFNNNANDESGNNLNGTVNGATITTDRFGNANKAYQFDGISNFITMGNPTLLQISNTITVSGWLRVQAFRTPPAPGTKSMAVVTKIFFDPSHGGNPTKGYRTTQDFYGDGTPSMTTNIYSSDIAGNNTSYLGQYVGGSIVAQEWISFCLVIDGTTMKYYRNGILTDNTTSSATLLADGSLGDLTIGTYGGGFLFNGQVDDIAIYNRALTAAEVLQVYKQNITQ